VERESARGAGVKDDDVGVVWVALEGEWSSNASPAERNTEHIERDRERWRER
jgi:hypothetical protein